MTHDQSTARPPNWAEALLRMLLRPDDRDSVSGDLLEEYRENILPARGAWRAGLWYLSQLSGFVWRSAGVWSVLLAASVLGREELDWWLSPTQDYYARSVVSTWTAVTLFAASGGWTAWRSHSIGAGVVGGAITGAMSAIIIDIASLGALAVKHDAHTMRMIAASGGLDEVFLLPFVIIVPGTLCAIVGGLIGKAAAWIYSASAKTNSA
jgi:hypothetical protein